MPRVMVVAEDGDRQVLMDEEVRTHHLDSDHSAQQLIERLVWSLHDAEVAERRKKKRKIRAAQPYQKVAAG